jgi:hypothetical protein
MKEPSEVDTILHYMRQSKMDAVRKGQDLLDPLNLHACLKDSPNMKRKRRHRNVSE